MLIFKFANGDRFNLENVNRIVTRPDALELQFAEGLSKVVTNREDIDRLEAVMGTGSGGVNG